MYVFHKQTCDPNSISLKQILDMFAFGLNYFVFIFSLNVAVRNVLKIGNTVRGLN